MPKVWKSQFHGYSYPRLLDHRWIHRIWERLFCRRGWHLWDEVMSGVGEAHYLYCDACGVTFVGWERDER